MEYGITGDLHLSVFLVVFIFTTPGLSIRGAKWMGNGAIKQPLGFKHHPLEGAGRNFVDSLLKMFAFYQTNLIHFRRIIFS